MSSALCAVANTTGGVSRPRADHTPGAKGNGLQRMLRNNVISFGQDAAGMDKELGESPVSLFHNRSAHQVVFDADTQALMSRLGPGAVLDGHQSLADSMGERNPHQFAPGNQACTRNLPVAPRENPKIN